MRKRGKDLRAGDVIKVWWNPGTDRIDRLVPYTGTLIELLGRGTRIASFALNPIGMTIPPDEIFKLKEAA